MVVPDPWRGGDHRQASEGNCDDAPCEHDFRDVLHGMVLEVAHYRKDEPSYAGRSAAGVNATNVLQERSEPDPEP